MVRVHYGGRRGKAFRISEASDLLVVRTVSRSLLDGVSMSARARRVLDEFVRIASFPSAGVEVFRTRRTRSGREVRDAARSTLRSEPEVEFAGRGLCDSPGRAPVVYTENIFVKFREDFPERSARARLRERGLLVKRSLDYAENAFFVSCKPGTGLRTFDVALDLLREEGVELCHPELIRERRRRAAFPAQWHLKRTVINGGDVNAHASVTAAWQWSEGQGVTIAIIDDGFDVDHEELGSKGKIVHPRDVTRGSDDPRPGPGDHHGTACAGVACADGYHGASGVAPRACLMPIRLAAGLGSLDEADAFFHAAKSGADVISCSWGPVDGDWWNASDPLHRRKVPLPDPTRLAIDWAVTHGRGGKGCAVFFAAGNGNESVDNDGYASYSRVIAVAACNDTGARSAYSDHGKAIECAFPSSHGRPSRTPGIWTTDCSGRSGYNPGRTSLGDASGNYTNSFGGTSSAAPGAAGVAALILGRNPGLSVADLRGVLRRSCDRIDRKGGRYGKDGHSPYYGHGRVNALRAVTLAAPPKAARGQRKARAPVKAK